jgi:predicted XRE-type DNA-binding protein
VTHATRVASVNALEPLILRTYERRLTEQPSRVLYGNSYIRDLAMKLKYSNIFEAIADSAEVAADMEFRADLMLVLRDFFHERGASQAQIGQMLGVPQPRVSELMTGKVDKFSSDKLIGFCAKVGIRFKPATVQASRGRPSRVKCDVSVAETA